MLRAALAYAAMGFAVFPCASKGKTPLTGRGFKDATKDHEVIRALWSAHPGANVGIATGAISGESKKVYFIEPGACIDCGACGVICPDEAILSYL